MRIAIVATEYVTEPNSYDGGMAVHWHKIAKGLKQLGHEPIVVVLSKTNEVFQHSGIEVHRVHPQPGLLFKFAFKLLGKYFGVALTHLLRSWTYRKKILELHKIKRIDVQHYSSQVGSSLFHARKIPFVLIASGSTRLIREADETFSNTVRERQVEFLQHLCYKAAKHIYAPSFLLANYLTKIYNKPVKVIETPFWFNSEEQFKTDLLEKVLEFTKGNPYLLFYGRMGAFKGVTDIVAALPNVFKQYPDIKFVFVGKDKGYKGQPMAKYIFEKLHGYEGRFFIHPNVEHSMLMPVIDAAFAVILPSRSENLSNAAIETMARGKILIGTRGASFDQLINHGENGYLCEIKNPVSIERAVDNLMKLSAEEKLSMQNAAKKTVERLKPEIVVKQLADFYLEAIAATNR
ncbi:MAG: glycosyltransferase family 4 protein [Chitinophagales bacterium]|nr:glycosyltransferase family 4 protein [Chitinophagales bacterium]